MDTNIFILTQYVFTYIDDWLKSQNLKLRQRGLQPRLHDSEVLAIEIAGAFWGISTDMISCRINGHVIVALYPDGLYKSDLKFSRA